MVDGVCLLMVEAAIPSVSGACVFSLLVALPQHPKTPCHSILKAVWSSFDGTGAKTALEAAVLKKLGLSKQVRRLARCLPITFMKAPL